MSTGSQLIPTLVENRQCCVLHLHQLPVLIYAPRPDLEALSPISVLGSPRHQPAVHPTGINRLGLIPPAEL